MPIDASIHQPTVQDALRQALISDSDASPEGLILSELISALCEEWLAYYQYWVSYSISRGLGKVDVDPEFGEHAREEKEHIEELMQRINELGGRPVTNPAEWSGCAGGWLEVETTDVIDQLKILINSEKSAITRYKGIIELSEGTDPTTNHLTKKILTVEEKHLYDLEMLLQDLVG